MNSPKSWTIVVFEEDQSVQAIPTKWLVKRDTCLWPVLPLDKLNSSLRNCEFNSCWPTHKVRVLRNATYENYAVAREKAKKAEHTSDLNSDTEYGFGKRRKIPLVYSESESEDNGNTFDQNLSKKRRKERQLIYSSDSEVDSNKKKRSIILPPPPKMKHQSLEVFNSDAGNNATDGNERSMKTPEPSNQGVGLEAHHESTSAKDIDETSTKCSKCCQKEKRSLYIITSLLVELNGKLDRILSGVSYQAQETNEGILQKSCLEFPINSFEDLKKFEIFLKEQSNYSSMVNYFSKLGGSNITEFTKRCMVPILSDSLARHYSYLGRKNNENFSSLIISQAIIDAAEKSKVSSTKRETEKAISAWLKRTNERIRRSSKCYNLVNQ